jgi:predicted outer membrane repeat protein
VRITREHTYTSQHLTVTGNGKLLTLQGEADGVTCYQLAHCLPVGGCHADTTQPLVTIDGSNTAGHVLTITGNSAITLRDLTITRGSADASVGGGGIQFNGIGWLYLDTSTVSLNYAGYGGGINVNGNGGLATLTLGPNSLVTSNVAQHDGGGVRLTGQARLFALQPQTLIGYNQAPNGYGGGIEVVGPARADIGSPGYNGVPAIYFNSANSGAGIAVIDNGSGEAVLREFATSASQPTAISNNTASSHGGGIFVTGQADACLFAPYIANNIAEDGAAVYYSFYVAGSANYATDSGIYINGGSPSRLGADCGPELVADLGGSRDCRPYDAQCSAFVSNATQHADGTGSDGGVISTVGGDLVATRFRIRESVAGSAFSISKAVVDRCLITDNGVSTLYRQQRCVPQLHNCKQQPRRQLRFCVYRLPQLARSRQRHCRPARHLYGQLECAGRRSLQRRLYPHE